MAVGTIRQDGHLDGLIINETKDATTSRIIRVGFNTSGNKGITK